MFLKIVTGLAVVLAGFTGIQENDELNGAKCIVNGERAASADHFVEYKKGKVYFCCGGCKAKFVADQELEEPKMSVKANHQLVMTGQYVQKGCPMSGNAIAEDAVAKVGGVEVGFCCSNCSNKVAEMETLEEKAAVVFSNDAFKKAYTKKADLSEARCPVSGGKVNEEHFASHHDGKVYFCCDGCKSKFVKDSEPFVVKSNMQLVQTGQVEQLACPFSGGDMDDEKVVEVGGISVKLCCGNCVRKVNAADSDEAKAELLFSAKAFDRGYNDE